MAMAWGSLICSPFPSFDTFGNLISLDLMMVSILEMMSGYLRRCTKFLHHGLQPLAMEPLALKNDSQGNGEIHAMIDRKAFKWDITVAC
mmetsp:Transcript_50968/g.76372  ORF Transcript_50968/g.76372 Transcript_50968/m.76372 type:complete len:89 (-) Transcript_50968:395-661(-)